MVSPQVFRVFIASPTDAADEREAAHEVVASVNKELEPQAVKFELVGWETVPGTARRPQDAINELVDQSDFMLCVFRKRWGSPPGGDLYSSGTEEELFTGLLSLGDTKRPMRDVCLVFAEYPGERRDKEVTDLQEQVVQSKALFFEHVISQTDYCKRLRRRLLQWAGISGTKPSLLIGLKPRSGRDVIRANQLRMEAEILASLGLVDNAEVQFKKAVSFGGLEEKLAYSVFLGRHDRIDESLEIVDNAMSELAAMENGRVEKLVEVLRMKASLKRRRADLDGAWASLKTALSNAIGDDSSLVKVRARINDELGVVAYKQGLQHRGKKQHSLFRDKFDEARRFLMEGLRERQELGDSFGVAQSEINLGRLEVALGNYDDAIHRHSSAILMLEPVADGTLANAYLARAQASLAKEQASREPDNQDSADQKERIEEAQTLLDSALDDAERSLALNKTLMNRRNEAMVLNVIAQIHGAHGNLDLAREYATECVRINEELGLTPLKKIRDLAGGLG